MRIKHINRLSVTIISSMIFLTLLFIPQIHAVIYTYDVLNRLIKVEYGNCQIIEYGYDDGGNILSITQASSPTEPVLSVTPAFQNVSAEKGTTAFIVANTGAGAMLWKTSENTEWFSISPDSGTNNDTITVNYEANSRGERTGAINITAEGAVSSPQTVQVRQIANTQPILSVTPLSLEVSVAIGTTTFDIDNTGSGTMNWQASESASWFSVSPVSGTNKEKVTVNYEANTGNERNGTIKITSEGA